MAAPHTYLEADQTEATQDTVALTRGMAGGILGLTSVSYMAAKSDSDEVKTVALCSGAAAFLVLAGNNVHRAMTKGSVQSQVDLGVCLGLFGVCAVALSSKK